MRTSGTGGTADAEEGREQGEVLGPYPRQVEAAGGSCSLAVRRLPRPPLAHLLPWPVRARLAGRDALPQQRLQVLGVVVAEHLPAAGGGGAAQRGARGQRARPPHNPFTPPRCTPAQRLCASPEHLHYLRAQPAPGRPPPSRPSRPHLDLGAALAHTRHDGRVVQRVAQHQAALAHLPPTTSSAAAGGG
jgi:hypothetical protein